MTLKFTILGCGSSGGVPRPALGWGVCDPANPKNRRRRTSLLVERHDNGGVTRVLVDTPPDLREQLLDANVDRLDGVLYTHEHADHIHGIDDLRAFFIKQRQLIDVYLDEHTAIVARTRFGYCFATPPGSEYPPILREHRLAAGQPVTINGPGGPITALPFAPRNSSKMPSVIRSGRHARRCTTPISWRRPTTRSSSSTSMPRMSASSMSGSSLSASRARSSGRCC